MATLPTPGPEAQLSAVDAAADAQMVSLVSSVEQGTAPPVETPPPTQEPAPAAPPQEAAPATQPSEAAAPTPAEPPSQARVITIDLDKLPPEARRDFEDALKKEGGDLSKVASRYWEFNNRLSRGAAAEPAKDAPTEPAAPPAPAPPEQLVLQETDRRIRLDSDIAQWSAQHADNQRQLGELLSIDPKDPAALTLASRKLTENIAYLSRRLSEPDIKENPEMEGTLRQQLMDARSVSAEVSRLRTESSYLNRMFLDRRDNIQRSVSTEVQQQNAVRAEQARQEQEIETYAQGVEAAWPSMVQAAAKANNIGTEIMAGFNRMARYEILGMLERGEIPNVTQLQPILDRAAKQYIQETDTGHRYLSRVYADRAKAQTPAPIIVPPNGQSQGTDQRAPANAAEVDALYDGQLAQHLGVQRLS